MASPRAASLAVAAAASTVDVARHVGHADAGSTLRQHYLAPGAEESANGASVGALLARDNAPAPREQSEAAQPDANAMIAALTWLTVVTLARGATR